MNGENEKPRRDVLGAVTKAAAEFFICAFIGWGYEMLLNYFVCGRFTDRGLLRLPICPIYGFCALPLTFIAKKGRVFISSAAVTTAAELIASYPTEKLAGYRLWDYSEWPLNFEGRVSVLSSAVFGILGIVYIYAVKPLVGWVYKKTGIILTAVCTVLAVLTAADFIIVMRGA